YTMGSERLPAIIRLLRSVSDAIEWSVRLVWNTTMVFASLWITSPAWAQSAAPTDDASAAARTLFSEARELAAQGKYEEACPKFQESQRLRASMGALYNLADCWDHLGRTASAWALFL